MKKKITILLVFLVIIGCYLYFFRLKEEWATDYKNATYMIAGQSVTLKSGVAENEATPNSATKVVTRYFGNEVKKDLDGDGRDDVVFLVTQETGGSGVFFYAVAAFNTKDGWKGSPAVFIGDRIAPQSSESGKGKIVIVNYADRKAGESFTVAPSMGKSIWLLFDPVTNQFGEVAKNFEGEADPSRMTLGMKKWVWIDALYSDGTKLVPKKAGIFTLTLSPNGRFSATTDCNGVGGTYAVNTSKITFTDMMSTLMYCEDSQESQFNKLLSQTESYLFTSKGELVFSLKMDSGTVTFR